MTEPRATCHTARALLLVLPALLAPTWTCADVIGSVNSVRSGSCDGRHVPAAPLRANARLDEAAHRLSQGKELRVALQLAGYHAVSSFAVSISNVPESGDMQRTLAQQFCSQVSNPALREIGTWRSGSQVWIALAEPFAPPAPRDQAAVSRRVVALTNEARAHARRCGASAYTAAAPLALEDTLSRVARDYAHDMARFAYMDHTGRDGSSPAERITRSGYRWSQVGENLASGVMSAEDVVAGWLASPEHCANLMDPRYREAGVGFAVNAHDERGVYWAMEFGTRR
ncbi:MAG: CAP domain-containing protein [Gammaproteobacteria bacterium]|nr:CAP domain-containing protein [Gammaproteobacteria bacterium]MBV8402734.1 CAP domain-containing protein [Gammaproteobacteria bacterium]